MIGQFSRATLEQGIRRAKGAKKKKHVTNGSTARYAFAYLTRVTTEGKKKQVRDGCSSSLFVTFEGYIVVLGN